MWAFIVEPLILQIPGIWCQVDEIRAWCKIFYPGMNIVTPLSVSCEKGQRGKLFLIYKALLPPATHKFWGDSWGCILWTSKIKTKVNTSTAWWNRQATIWHSSCGGVTYTRWTVGVIKQRKNPEPDFLARPQLVVIQIINDMIRGKQITPSQIFTRVNNQGAVMRLRPTLYSLWGMHLKAAPNA